MLYLDQKSFWKFIESYALQDEIKFCCAVCCAIFKLILTFPPALVVALPQKFVGKHKSRCSTWIRRAFGNSSKTPSYMTKSWLVNLLVNFEKLTYRLSQALVVVLPQKFVGKHKRRCSTWISWGFENSSKTPSYKMKRKVANLVVNFEESFIDYLRP